MFADNQERTQNLLAVDIETLLGGNKNAVHGEGFSEVFA